jgi:hypothetical protein
MGTSQGRRMSIAAEVPPYDEHCEKQYGFSSTVFCLKWPFVLYKPA